VFCTASEVVIVLEYAIKGSCLDYDGWPEAFEERTRLAFYFFQQLICALEYCHSKGLVHRDIKLGNSLIQVQPQLYKGVMTNIEVLKLADFGLSTSVSAGDDHCVGTAPYVAPVRCIAMLCQYMLCQGCL
jgi:serine/threonine-protein kinase SRK2